jgi:hypothetical protein
LKNIDFLFTQQDGKGRSQKLFNIYDNDRGNGSAKEKRKASPRDINEQPTKEVEVQTMYRESEAQTTPYSPDYIVPKGHNPEILELAEYGVGMAASKIKIIGTKGNVVTEDDAEIVRHIRYKRQVQASLPPLSNDPTENEERLKMLEDQEVKEWKLREKQIKQ